MSRLLAFKLSIMRPPWSKGAITFGSKQSMESYNFPMFDPPIKKFLMMLSSLLLTNVGALKVEK